MAEGNTATMAANEQTIALTIHLTCRKEDVIAARKIQDQLNFLGNKRLKVTVSDVLPSGVEWRPKVVQELARADRLVLLYSDPRQNWDACLYESGFFDGRSYPNNTMRLVVLHDADCEPPGPLKSFHPVKISPTDRGPLRQFIHEIFAEAPETGVAPINPDLEGRYAQYQTLLEDAIIDCVSGPQEKYKAFAKEILIEVPSEALRKERAPDDKMPKEARVFGDAHSLELFKLQETEEGYPWKEFYKGMDKVSDHTEDWVGALVNMMEVIAFTSENLDSTGLPLYRYRWNDRSEMYRPCIRSFREKKGILSFKILFADLPKETTVEPAGVATTLAQALTAARMFRWGVLQRLKNGVEELNAGLRNGKLRTDEWLKSTAEELYRFLGQKLTIMVESLNRGYQRDELLSHFRDPSRSQVSDTLDEWDSFCVGVKDLADRLNGGEDVSPDEVLEMVQTALNVNKGFMVLCAERYTEALKGL